MAKKTKKIVYCAVLTAVAAVVASFTIKFGDIFELSLAPVIVMLAGVLLGPVYGMACGVASDLIGTVVIGSAYNPVFAATWLCYGLIPGLLIKKIPATFIRSAVSTVITQMICSVGLNTLWIYIFYGAGLSSVRLMGSFSSMGVYIAVFYILQKTIARYSFGKTENPA